MSFLSASSIASEHHLQLVSNRSELSARVDKLRPFSVTQGTWFLQIQYISCTGPLVPSLTPFAGLKIVSLNATSNEEKPLILASFLGSSLEKEGTVIFERPQTFRISHASDRLWFEVQTLTGEKVSIKDGGVLMLGVALLRER